MTVASEVFSPEHERATLFMGWRGRGESPTEIASRLLPTMKVLTGLYPEGNAAFHVLEGDSLDRSRQVPDALDALSSFAAVNSDREPNGEVREKGRTRLVSILLPKPSDPVLRSDAMLTVAAGTPLALDNSISLMLEDSFPIGTPSEAARWFLDLVRIWQPEFALLKTSLTNRTYSANGTYAGYLSWASEAALGSLPEVPSAVRIPFGTGALYAARQWTVGGVGDFIEDLRRAGAASVREIPQFQSPPTFPEDYPAGLNELDEAVAWGPGLDANSAG